MAQLSLAILAVLALSLVGIWDSVAMYRGDMESVSKILTGWCKQWPVLPFLAGLVVGHALWPQQ